MPNSYKYAADFYAFMENFEIPKCHKNGRNGEKYSKYSIFYNT